MYPIIREALTRQHKALDLLHGLLEEEYHSLLDRELDAVVALEFSIQELIRQLAVEKSLVMRTLGGRRVAQYAETLPVDRRAGLLDSLRVIDAGEQRVARQASRNSTLSLALLDQSSRNLQELTGKATPRQATTYGRRGAMRYQQHPQAALISGRL